MSIESAISVSDDGAQCVFCVNAIGSADRQKFVLNFLDAKRIEEQMRHAAELMMMRRGSKRRFIQGSFPRSTQTFTRVEAERPGDGTVLVSFYGEDGEPANTHVVQESAWREMLAREGISQVQ